MAISIVVRDRISRLLTFNHEIKRKALSLVVKNKENEFMIRLKAQMELQKMIRFAHSGHSDTMRYHSAPILTILRSNIDTLGHPLWLEDA